MENPLISTTLTLRKYSRYFFLLFFGALILFSIKSAAQGDLLIFPKRIVFEGSKKSQTLNLANSGRDTVRYLISVVQIRMKEDGAFETITRPDSGQYFADKNFRFFPRNVILAPNESQSIKLQLTNMGGLEAGEYRSHLYFRAEPVKNPLGEDEIAGDSTSISVNLVAIFGISIPVIIRVGESTTVASISDASLLLKSDSTPSLNLTLTRTGNMSVYGDVSVDYISVQGKITHLGVAKGMALYTPTTARHINLLLNKNAGIDYHNGKLRIAYTTQPDAKSVRIAETEVVL